MADSKPKRRRFSLDLPGSGPKGARTTTLAEQEKAAALQMGLFALEKAMGGTVAQISAKYHVTREAVEEALSSADRLQFVEAYRDIVRDRLVPVALVVYEMHLRQGSLDAAKTILEGVGVLQKPGAMPLQPGDEAESLLAYRVRRPPSSVPAESDPPLLSLPPC